MADFITSITTVSGLRTWWDSTVPSTISSGDRYIAELAAGSYDLGSVSSTWGSKTVSGAIIIRPQTAAKLTTTTRALRAGTDGVLFSFPNSNVNFTSANVTLDGCQFVSSAAPSATLQLSTGGVISRCILDDVKATFDNSGGSLLDNLITRTQSDVCAWLPASCTVSGNTFVHFAGGTPVATGSAITAKNNAFISIGGSTSFSGTMDGSSTNNAFNVGTTYGTSPVTITPSAQFVSVSSHAAADLRLQSGVSMATGGVSSGGTGTDIYYQTRTASYSIGSYELDAASGSVTTINATTANSVGSLSSFQSPVTAINATTANTVGSVQSVSGTASTTISATTDNVVVSLASVGNTANGTFTSEALRDNVGNLIVSKALNYVALYNDSTGALVIRKTGLSTNSSGVFSFTDAALTSGVTYRVDWEDVDGRRRMPRKAAA